MSSDGTNLKGKAAIAGFLSTKVRGWAGAFEFLQPVFAATALSLSPLMDLCVFAQMAGGPIALRFTANDALPSQTTGGIAVFATGELVQGSGVRALIYAALITSSFCSCVCVCFSPAARAIPGGVYVVPHRCRRFVCSQ